MIGSPCDCDKCNKFLDTYQYPANIVEGIKLRSAWYDRHLFECVALPLPCEHLGGYTGEMGKCLKGCPKPVPLRQCAVKGRCVPHPGKPVKDIQNCFGKCDSYSAIPKGTKCGSTSASA